MSRAASGLLALLLTVSCSSRQSGEYTTWSVYGGDPTGSRYSDLRQITPENVARLQVAWTYRTGDARADNRSQIQCNPIIVGSVLYGSSPGLKIFALNAATGTEIWSFDPFADGAEQPPMGTNRGVTYWTDGRDARILATAGTDLFALDARTGALIPSFGHNGRVDLRKGLDRDADNLFVISTTPGAIYNDLLILGTRVSEGPGPSAPGHIRAYNVRTGERAWIFHTIPHPGELGYDTWPPDAWTRAGGANAWAGMTVDHARGLVFVPTGSASFDFHGGDRHGENLFANSILALKAETGERVWHYQVVKHDLWDRDLPAPPNLITVERNGRRIDAVAQITKSGHVIVLNRETGEPLFPQNEIEVPASHLEGEQAWPTQRLPASPAPFARQVFTEADITDISPEAHAHVRERFARVRSGGQFVPPSLEGTIIFPGFDGGGEWGGAAHDPRAGILYVNANEMPWILTMVKRDVPAGTAANSGRHLYALNCAGCHGPNREGGSQGIYPSLRTIGEKYTTTDLLALMKAGRGWMPPFNYLSDDQRGAIATFLLNGEDTAVTTAANGYGQPPPYGHTGYNRFVDQDGYPAVKPPWGTLNAIDLNTGDLLWQVPLGEFADLSARGIPKTGTENYGGPVVTAGGLIFIGASKDGHFRAFDKRTGEELWKTRLPAGGYATPATYEVDGKQYVVIAAGGGKMSTPSGDSYVAFALPAK